MLYFNYCILDSETYTHAIIRPTPLGTLFNNIPQLSVFAIRGYFQQQRLTEIRTWISCCFYALCYVNPVFNIITLQNLKYVFTRKVISYIKCSFIWINSGASINCFKIPVILMDYFLIIDSKQDTARRHNSTGLTLGWRPANEKHCYKVTPSLIGWAQT